jgi:hypothetical protein
MTKASSHPHFAAERPRGSLAEPIAEEAIDAYG